MTPGAPEACAAFVGIDWADATHAVCLQAAGSEKRAACILEHTPETINAWGSRLRTRFHGQPLAICLARNHGPLVSALRTDDFLVRFPIHPMTVARDREAFTPSRATDAPTDAALQLALLLTPRDTLQPLQPQRPPLRARAQLGEPRRRVVGENVRLTPRLTRTLQNACPPGLPWFPEPDPRIFCALLRRWPTRTAAPRARRATLETFCRDHHGRAAAVIATRLHARQAALPWTHDAGVSAPHALLVQTLVSQRRGAVHAIEACDTARAQRAQHHPDVAFFQALPGASPVVASRLLGALGEQRAR